MFPQISTVCSVPAGGPSSARRPALGLYHTRPVRGIRRAFGGPPQGGGTPQPSASPGAAPKGLRGRFDPRGGQGFRPAPNHRFGRKRSATTPGLFNKRRGHKGPFGAAHRPVGRREPSGRRPGARVWRLVAGLSKKAGLEGFQPRLFRHTFAAWLLREAGADLVAVAALLGHESLSTTARYTRPSAEELEAALERL